MLACVAYAYHGPPCLIRLSLDSSRAILTFLISPSNLPSLRILLSLIPVAFSFFWPSDGLESSWLLGRSKKPSLKRSQSNLGVEVTGILVGEGFPHPTGKIPLPRKRVRMRTRGHLAVCTESAVPAAACSRVTIPRDIGLSRIPACCGIAYLGLHQYDYKI